MSLNKIKRDIRILLGVALGTYAVVALTYLLLTDKMDKQADRIERAIQAKSQRKAIIEAQTGRESGKRSSH